MTTVRLGPEWHAPVLQPGDILDFGSDVLVIQESGQTIPFTKLGFQALMKQGWIVEQAASEATAAIAASEERESSHSTTEPLEPLYIDLARMPLSARMNGDWISWWRIKSNRKS